jgi:NADH-quinone oxidoreductase subunit J
MNLFFYLSASVAVLSTFLVITRKNAVHALLYLIVSLLAVALVFFSLGAPFAAALEVIIYAGAIMVLFVFVIMMLNLGPEAAKQESVWLRPGTWIGPSVLALILAVELIAVFLSGTAETPGAALIGPKQIGIALFGPYVLGVELASLLLLAGLIGAYHLGRPEEDK